MSDMASTEAAVEQAAQTGAEGSQEGAQAQQAPADPGVMARLDELGSQIGSMFEQFGPVAEHYAQQQQPQDPFAEFGGEEFVNSLSEATGVDPQQLMAQIGQMVDQRAQQIVGQQLGPVQEQLRHQGFVELEQRYPDMQDEQKGTALWHASVERMAQIAGIAPEQAADLVTPEFVELVYKAGIADQHAQAQSAQGEQQEVQLEQAGASAQQQAEPSRQEQILAAPGGASGPNGFRWM